MKTKEIAEAILCVGLACVAAYLNVNGEDAFFLWLGAFLCFLSLCD